MALSTFIPCFSMRNRKTNVMFCLKGTKAKILEKLVYVDICINFINI